MVSLVKDGRQVWDRVVNPETGAVEALLRLGLRIWGAAGGRPGAVGCPGPHRCDQGTGALETVGSGRLKVSRSVSK